MAMPLLNGLQATRQILTATPTNKVLMLSAHSDDVYVEEATNSSTWAGSADCATAAAFSREQILRWLLSSHDDLANKRLYECPATALLPDAIWLRGWRNKERKAGHAI